MVNNSASPLAQLRDIHLPKPIAWWPLAYGWIILFFLMVAASLFALWITRRYYQQGRARREGLRLLMQYEKEYQQGASSHEISIKISEVLRRVALMYFPREDIAGLQGNSWLDFLNQTGKGIHFDEVRECLLVLPYQSEHTRDLNLLLSYAKKWIKQRRGRCLN